MRKRYTNLESQKISRFLFVLCWAVYFGLYFSREGYNTALGALTTAEVFNSEQASTIGMTYFFAYGTGQLCSGFLADRISPFKMIGAGVFCSAVANFVMAASGMIGTEPNLMVLIITWGLNGLAQSMLWTPILFIMSNLLATGQCERACLNIASTVPLGTLGAYLVSGIVLKFAAWDKVFLASSIVLAVIFVGWLVMSLYIKRFIKYKDDIKTIEPDEPVIQKAPSQNKLLPLLIASGVLVALIPITINGMLREGVNTWVPTMISESFKVDMSDSAFLSLVLPIVNLSGAYAALFVYKRFFKNEIKSAIVFFVIAITFMAGLIVLNIFSGVLGKTLTIIMGVVILAIITSAMLAINQLFITMMPVHFAKHGKVATISGMMNFIAYMGCAIAIYTFGSVKNAFGDWNPVIVMWIGFSVVAMILCFVTFKRWGNFTKENHI